MLQQVSTRCTTLVQGVAQDLSHRLEQCIEVRHAEAREHAKSLYDQTKMELQQVGAQLAQHDAAFNSVRDDVRQLQLQVASMQANIATQADDRAILDPSYDRSPDSGVLKLNH